VVGRSGQHLRAELGALAALFLKLGVISFGGPAAHIAMMEDEVVTRRQWLTREEFMDLLGATNLIPGPNSTEMAIHVGRRRAGWPGLLVAGGCFILPSMVIVMALGWAYVRFGARPAARGLLHGIKPVIIAIVVQALVRLAPAAVKSRWLGLLALGALGLTFAGVHELVILFGTGALVALLRAGRAGRQPAAGFALAAGGGVAASAAPVAFGLLPLFLFFLKVGAVLFGSGYVLLAFLRADLVERWHWLTESQLLDAVAVGQLTPGPVSTTATFIGYVLGGPTAGLVATAGIFLPAFVFVAASGPLVPRLRRSRLAGGFLDGVNVASLALMAEVTWSLGRAAIVDLPTAILAVVSAIALLRFRLSSAWLVLAGAIAGLLLRA
jgi:chromate transporter